MNGTGVLVWDAVFGVWVGWSDRDRATLRAISRVQRALPALLERGDWAPLAAMSLVAGDVMAVKVTPSEADKCERCWHWRADVGADEAHPTICGRCTSNLFGAGEDRTVA